MKKIFFGFILLSLSISIGGLNAAAVSDGKASAASSGSTQACGCIAACECCNPGCASCWNGFLTLLAKCWTTTAPVVKEIFAKLLVQTLSSGKLPTVTAALGTATTVITDEVAQKVAAEMHSVDPSAGATAANVKPLLQSLVGKVGPLASTAAPTRAMAAVRSSAGDSGKESAAVASFPTYDQLIGRKVWTVKSGLVTINS